MFGEAKIFTRSIQSNKQVFHIILNKQLCYQKFQTIRAMTRVKRRRGGDSSEIPLDVQVEILIPLDVQIEILARLPHESLMRFKCVSKCWYILIHSRYFTNLYRTVASSRPQQPQLYMSLVDEQERLLLSLSPSSSSNNAESLVPDLTMPGLGGDWMAVLRGLVLCTASCGDMCIYNPTTRQTLILPEGFTDLPPQEGCGEYGYYFFGHDPVLDQYKVVHAFVICSEDYEMIITEYHVFVLEAGGSWRAREYDEPPLHHMPGFFGRRTWLCINGVIYYLALTSMSHFIIVSFDVGTEEIKEMELPYSFSTIDGVKARHMGFIEYGGKPAILDHKRLVPEGLVDLWVLEDGGRWSKKPLALQPCQMHLVDKDVSLTVQGTTQNGEAILAPFYLVSPYYILYYDQN
uniref:Putative F-box protein n=2 Tax=Noccaea caerulescens TaxID=107243 RepID=A0A1J3J133_NOCCA